MSSFSDSSILSTWSDMYSTPGVFRNPRYYETRRRQLSTASKVVVQINPEHIKTKRPTTIAPTSATMDSALTAVSSAPVVPVSRDFDPSAFNFMKASHKEIVATIDPRDGASLILPTALLFDSKKEDLSSTTTSVALAEPAFSTSAGTPAAPPHILFVNVNPLLMGHCLLTPFMAACKPQVITEEGLLAALQLASAATRQDFRVGFNSLGAWASVNHLHFHAFWCSEAFGTEAGMPIEAAARVSGGAQVIYSKHFAEKENGTASLSPSSPPPSSSSSVPVESASEADAMSTTSLHARTLQILYAPSWPVPFFVFRWSNVSSSVGSSASSSSSDSSSSSSSSGNSSSSNLIGSETASSSAGGHADVSVPLRVASTIDSLVPVDAAFCRALLAKIASRFVKEVLVKDNIAHNLLIVEQGNGLLVIPRRTQIAGRGAAVGEMAVALAEVCGLGILYSEADFESMTAASFEAILREEALPYHIMGGLRAAILSMTNEDTETPPASSR